MGSEKGNPENGDFSEARRRLRHDFGVLFLSDPPFRIPLCGTVTLDQYHDACPMHIRLIPDADPDADSDHYD